MCQSRASCLPCQLDPWFGFFRTPRPLTVIALRVVSVLMNFVTFHPTTMGNGMIEGISGYDTLVHSQSFGSLASSTNRLNFVCSFHFTYQSQSFNSPVFGRAYGERVLPNPNSLLQFQFTIARNPTHVNEAWWIPSPFRPNDCKGWV